jgi:hypothetical protein
VQLNLIALFFSLFALLHLAPRIDAVVEVYRRLRVTKPIPSWPNDQKEASPITGNCQRI